MADKATWSGAQHRHALTPHAVCRAEWERIGDVMSRDDSGGGGGSMQVGSKMHNGQEWDFVFDVDVEDGMPVKNLPYNRHENPYDAADRCAPSSSPLRLAVSISVCRLLLGPVYHRLCGQLYGACMAKLLGPVCRGPRDLAEACGRLLMSCVVRSAISTTSDRQTRAWVAGSWLRRTCRRPTGSRWCSSSCRMHRLQLPTLCPPPMLTLSRAVLPTRQALPPSALQLHLSTLTPSQVRLHRVRLLMRWPMHVAL